MTDSPHLVILASAGTGKTWRLTHRLIALLASGVPPERMLASTFTRKAAGEILQRLVARLVEASCGDEVLDEVNAQLALEPGRPRLDRTGARELLISLLRQLHRIDVRTLDALFHQLARVHGWETSLPPGWQIASQAEADALQLRAVGRVLQRYDRAAMLALLAALGEGAPRRSIHRDLHQLVQQGHRAWLESSPAAWESVGHPAGPPAGEVEAARNFLLQLPAELEAELLNGRFWPDSLPKLREALARDEWKRLLSIGPAKNLLEGRDSYDDTPFDGPLGAALGTVVDHAVHVVLSRADTRARAWRELMVPFDAAFLALQRERRLVRFDDIPRALREAELPGSDAARLAFRLDGSPDHVLLDEFQDTSTAQWGILRPLVERALQAGPASRSLFCVGDVKQAIFGWRDAEPRLLRALGQRDQMRSEDLALSRRSAPAVMRAVNRVFGDLARNAAFEDDEVLAQAASIWGEGLQEHRTAREEVLGAVRLWELPARKGADRAQRDAALARAAAQLVARLTAAEPEASIGVLVRRNAPIPRVILELRRLGVLASGEGGNPLTDSESAQLILSLLVLADHPGDEAAAFHVATSPLGPLVGVNFSRRETWRAASQRVRRALLAGGLGAWLSDMRNGLVGAGPLEDRERQRLGQLVDLGLAWDERATLRPGDFVEHVRRTPVEEPAASRVRVLTIHTAKGLEFDAVVCPELEYSPPQGRGLMVERPDPEGPITRVFPFVSRAVAARWEPAATLLAAVRRRSVIEELSVLYVALTRARRRLDLLVTRGGGRGATFAKILRSALASPAPRKPRRRKGEPELPDDTPTGPVLLYGELDAPATDALLSDAHRPEPPTDPTQAVQSADTPPSVVAPQAPLALRRGGPGLVLRRRTPSEREGGGFHRVRELLALGTREARVRGVVVHAWMERVGWSEEPLPLDAELLELGRRLLLRMGAPGDEARLPGWLAWWHAAIVRTNTRALLSLNAARARAAVQPNARPDLWRERRFLILEEDVQEAGAGPVLVPGAFDRVVVWRDADGSALAAEVVDFKTDAVEGGNELQLADRTTHYAPQMEAYRRAVAAQTGLPPAAIACRLLFLEADVVRDVAG